MSLMRSNSGRDVFVEDWLLPNMPAQFTCTCQWDILLRCDFSSGQLGSWGKSYSIVNPSGFRNYTVDESVYKPLIGDITDRSENDSIVIEFEKLRLHLLEFDLVDISDGNNFAPGVHECLRNSSSD